MAGAAVGVAGLARSGMRYVGSVGVDAGVVAAIDAAAFCGVPGDGSYPLPYGDWPGFCDTVGSW